MEQWLPVNFPKVPDKAIVYPDPFDFVKHGMGLEHPTVEIINGAGATTMTLSANGNVADILQGFGGDPQKAEGLAEFLGFEPIPNPEDRLAGPLSGGLKQFCGAAATEDSA